MSTFLPESLLIAVLIVANGIFSGSEIAIVSARKLRLQHQADHGNRKAEIALKLARNPNEFLSTIQIGITLIGILSGAVGGATIAQRLQPLLANIPLLAAYAGVISLGIVVLIISCLSLLIGELVPKRIALSNPERIACAVAGPMKRLSRWTAPLVHLLGVSTDTIIRLLGIRDSKEPEVTEEEVKAMIRQGAKSGVFEEAEQDMVQRVFRLGDRSIKAMMTPRTEISWLDADDSHEVHVHQVMTSNHSLFPVGKGSLDDCIGVIRGRQLLAAQLAKQPGELDAFLEPPLFVTETTRVLHVIEKFKQTGVHVALVTDEFGGIDGLVTLTDLMEAIVGDLSTADEREDPLIIEREDGSWLLDGSLDIADFKDLVGMESLSLAKEDSETFHTLGGFVMYILERIPSAGEWFDWNGLRFEVVDMDGNRVDKILLTRCVPTKD